jgi:hypothetical protein
VAWELIERIPPDLNLRGDQEALAPEEPPEKMVIRSRRYSPRDVPS